MMDRKYVFPIVILSLFLLFFVMAIGTEKQVPPPGCYTNTDYTILACWSGDYGWGVVDYFTILYDRGEYASYILDDTAVILSPAKENPLVPGIYWKTISSLDNGWYVVTSSWQTETVKKYSEYYIVVITIPPTVYTFKNTLIPYTQSKIKNIRAPVTVIIDTTAIDNGTIATVPFDENLIVAQDVALVKYLSMNKDKLYYTEIPVTNIVGNLFYDSQYSKTILMPWDFLRLRRGVCIEFALLYAGYFIDDTFTFVAIAIDGHPYAHVAVIHNGLVYENKHPGEYGVNSMVSWLFEYGDTLTMYYMVFSSGTLVDVTTLTTSRG